MHERLAKVEKLTLQEQIYDQLKTGLMRGQFSPGDVLVTRKLAAEMGTSVMPVRDALHRLAAERALVLLPNRSVAVPTTTRDQFDQLTEIRTRLESLAAERAASRIGKAELAALTDLNTRMEAAIRRGDGATVLETNMALHLEVYRAADAEILLGNIESLWLRFGPLLVVPLYRRSEVFDQGAVHHRDLIAALAARDPAAAGRAVRADIEQAAKWYARHRPFDDAAAREPERAMSGARP
ncbi:GntR family transcriptional regulator [Geminicoccus harenae]|uniref:GntR family transcriptional regulator n=2 Tax=Geminicoccus harenae TaxID=2498453 RepID=UPI001C984CA1|nr:GntR family transcriptional regulator [Geminicoccus harenae]